jgi:hypothetical protein
MGTSLLVVCIHVFGDIPFPPVFGAVATHLQRENPGGELLLSWGKEGKDGWPAQVFLRARLSGMQWGWGGVMVVCFRHLHAFHV